MHDKQVVRRRRAVLGLLVAVSLILLTAYFGESPSSPLHSVQRGVAEVFSPVQEGASKVLSPVRDVAGWFSDTFRAKSQVQKLRQENQRLITELAQAQAAEAQNSELRREVGLQQSVGLAAYQPVGAAVISQDPNLWYATIEVDKGSADGVRLDDPVVGDGALVGEVSTVDSSVCWITLITDHSFAVSAAVQDGREDSGVLEPAFGNPNSLVLEYLDRHAPIQVGQQVVTSGFRDPSNPALQSLFPGGIPIGQVTSASQGELLSAGQVQVNPAADLRHLSTVQILTHPSAGGERAALPSG